MAQSKEEQLWQASTDGNLALVQELASDQSVDVNWGDAEVGRSPFYRACYYGHTEVVKYLMGLPSVDVCQKQNEGATPFCCATSRGKIDVVALLMDDQRVDINEGWKDGATPFFQACQNDHKEIIAMMLTDRRLDPNAPNSHQETPFFISCVSGHLGVVTMLMASPVVDVLRARDDGCTPFFFSCYKAHIDIVALLLSDPRVDINQPWSDNGTPLWSITQNGHLPVAQLVMAWGRDLDTQRKSAFNGKTAAEQGRLMATVDKDVDESEEDYKRVITYGPAIGDLIDEYEQDPVAVRQRLRRTAGVREYFIANFFALLVFFSDHFLRLSSSIHPDTERFFKICTQLPLEVQMVLCNRMYGSARDVVFSRFSEKGFLWLSRASTWAEVSTQEIPN